MQLEVAPTRPDAPNAGRWETVPLADEFTVELGKMLDAEKNVGVSKLFLGNAAVQWGRFNITNLGRIKLAPQDLQRYRLRVGDLLVCEGGEVGRCAIWQDELPECYYQKALHRLRPKRGYNVVFLRYVLEYFAGQGVLSNYVTQTSIAHLPKDKLEALAIPRPPQDEQQAIAQALSDSDSYIESLQQLLAKKRAIMQGAMQGLLTGKHRLPGFSGKWKIRTLHDLATLKSGEPITSAKINESARYPCYGGNGLRGYTDSFTHEGEYALIGRQGALCGNVVSVSGRFFASEHAVVVRPNQNTDIKWLAFVLRQANLNRYSESSAQPGLSVAKIAVLKVIEPPTKDEQTAIATVLCDMTSEMDTLEDKLKKARDLKQGMIQELLTGRVRLI